jgi:hypothetical protein
MTSSALKPITFTVAFTVDRAWIADGFMLTDDRAKSMLSHTLHGAHGSEIAARVLAVSDHPATIFERYQGSTSADAARRLRAYEREAPNWRRIEATFNLVSLALESSPLAVNTRREAQAQLRQLINEYLAPAVLPQED